MQYQYSSTGRLLAVTTADKAISYRHNALGQRVAKLVDGVVTEKYLWQNLTTLLAVYDANDNVKQRFEYGLSHTPVSFTQGGQRYYIQTDHLGSPRVVSSATGTVIKTLSYDSYGNVISDSNPDFTVPFGFAGGLYDADTGLVRFGYRDYDPQTGRWTARDPIGFAGGDTNLYGYVLGDPVNFIDPDGLEAVVIATPLPDKGFSFVASGKGLEGRIEGKFNTDTTNFNQIKPGTYTVTPRPALPNTFWNWLRDRNKNAGRPTISNTGDWNTIKYPDGSITTGAQFHPGRNGSSGGISQGCMVSDQATYDKLNSLFQRNYSDGGVTLIVLPGNQ